MLGDLLIFSPSFQNHKQVHFTPASRLSKTAIAFRQHFDRLAVGRVSNEQPEFFKVQETFGDTR
jgi:hypothetical protein